MTRFRVVAVATVALLLLPGLCGFGQKQRQKLGGTPAAERMQREVRHQLLLLPYYNVFDNLAFQVQGSTVTLLGQVTNPTLKSDAQKAVKGIEGVEQVNNQIEVLPPSPMDDQLRRAEYHAIFGDDRLFRYGLGAVPSIHIIVKGGHVTLVGVVDNQSDKDVASIRAKGVSGVFSVDNQLQVEKR